MRRAPTELRPLTRPGNWSLLLLLAVAPPVGAQASADVTERALAAAEIATTRLAGAWVPQGGGSLSFRVSRAIEIGGAARVGLSSPTVSRGGSNVRLHFGYAGVRVSVLPSPERWSGMRVGVLVGAGNADVKDPALGSLLDSDNGPVIEPSLSYSRALAAKVAASAAASWRFTSHFNLPVGAVRSRDLRGFAIGLAISVGPF